jgi:hypothetical protein
MLCDLRHVQKVLRSPETIMPSRLELLATLTAAPVAFGGIWLTGQAVLGGSTEPETLAAPVAAYPGHQITMTGTNYSYCAPEHPDPESSGGAAPGPVSAGPDAWVGGYLDGKSLGVPVRPDATGSITLSVTLPASLAPGRHRLTTRCEASGGRPTSGTLATARISVPWPATGGIGPRPPAGSGVHHRPVGSTGTVRQPAQPAPVPGSSGHAGGPQAGAPGSTVLGAPRSTPAQTVARSPTPPASGTPVRLLGWAGGLSLVVLVGLVFVFWTPLARILRRRHPASVPLLIPAGKSKVVFTGHDRSGLSVQVSHRHGDASFAIGIQVRPDSRGYAGHAEVTA